MSENFENYGGEFRELFHKISEDFEKSDIFSKYFLENFEKYFLKNFEKNFDNF